MHIVVARSPHWTLDLGFGALSNQNVDLPCGSDMKWRGFAYHENSTTNTCVAQKVLMLTLYLRCKSLVYSGSDNPLRLRVPYPPPLPLSSRFREPIPRRLRPSQPSRSVPWREAPFPHSRVRVAQCNWLHSPKGIRALVGTFFRAHDFTLEFLLVIFLNHLRYNVIHFASFNFNFTGKTKG